MSYGDVYRIPDAQRSIGEEYPTAWWWFVDTFHDCLVRAEGYCIGHVPSPAHHWIFPAIGKTVQGCDLYETRDAAEQALRALLLRKRADIDAQIEKLAHP